MVSYNVAPATTSWCLELTVKRHLLTWRAISARPWYEATRLFASNLNARMAQRFYSLVLLPRVRDDIAEHKRLHFALYQAWRCKLTPVWIS